VKSLKFKVILFVLFLTACSQLFPESIKKSSHPLKPALTLTEINFDRLPGWEGVRPKLSLIAFIKSCNKIAKFPRDALIIETSDVAERKMYGRGIHWHTVCNKAKNVEKNLTTYAAKKYFEKHFIPYEISDGGKVDGLITGYFEPFLIGSRKPTLEFSVPLYKLPIDLVVANLGKFKPELKGHKVVGKITNSELVPYDDRAEIQKGSLEGRALELYWVKDPIEAFFLHIQGSGVIMLPDGNKERVGYAGKNGQPYFAIGRELIARGVLKKKQVSLQTIRTWLKRHPTEAQRLMNKNKSYVFFRKIKGPGPIGAQGVPLTAGHSLAVDRRYFPLGAPIWLDTTNPLNPSTPLRRLVIAQDTGGAIKGIVRADLFWGAGVLARQGAGKMKEVGRLYILLPRSATTGRNQ